MGLLVVQVGLGDEAGARAGPGTWGSLGGSPGSSLGGGVALGQALAWLAPFLVRGFEHAVTAPFRRRAALSGRVSESQRGVLIGLIEGKTEREIALAMERSPHTVHDHVKSIYGELGVSNRSQLQALWYGWGGEGEGSGGKAEW
jgi:DNA-binding CsgD family transcriptional regulator